jgi:hypothetical protein
MTTKLIYLAWWIQKLRYQIIDDNPELFNFTSSIDHRISGDNPNATFSVDRNMYRNNALITDSYQDPVDYPDLDEANLFQPNRDIPDNITFYDMGLAKRINPWLDPVDNPIVKPIVINYHQPSYPANRLERFLNKEWAIQRLKEITDDNRLRPYPNFEPMINEIPLFSKISTMNDRDFRERCIVRNGKLQFLYEKRAVDILKPNAYTNPEWLADKLEIPYDLAYKMTEVFRSMDSEDGGLDVDRKTFNKMLYGYLPDHIELIPDKPKFGKPRWIVTNRHTGILGYGRKDQPPRTIGGGNDNVAKKIIELLETLADELDNITVKKSDFISIEEAEQQTTAQHALENFDPTEDLELVAMGWMDTDNSEDNLEIMGENNPFSTYTLHDGSEALSHEFITILREADMAKLKEIQSNFYPSKNPYTGRKYAPKYWYMTPSQKSQAWVYIKARKEELANAAGKNVSIDGQLVLKWIRDPA